MKFSVKTLEYDKIISKISKNTYSKKAYDFLNKIHISTDINEVRKMLKETKEMLNLIVKYGKIPFLENFDNNILTKKDIERIYSIEELLYLKLFLSMEKDIVLYKNNIENKSIILDNYLYNLNSHDDLFNKFLFIFNDNGQINDKASKDLYEIRRNIKRLENNLNSKMNELLTKYKSYLTEDVIVTRNNRYCLAIKDSYKNKVKGVIHDMSASRQTIFIEPDIALNINAEIEHYKLLEQKEIIEILKLLTKEVNNNLYTLRNNLNIYIKLDIIQSKALYSLDIEGYMPNINNDGYVNLINAKHPLLDLNKAVPISLKLDSKNNTLLITGPNTGGKTVALKTVGLLTLMIQTGILIPVNESSNLAVFDNIFADIGDEQSISQSLSTFSSHMTKIVYMINNLTNNSLILLDELGSGTDPIEGVSLAIAIIEEFRKKDVRMIVTSHYPELKTYAYETNGITTASVAFDKNSLKPLYYLQHGISGESHARLIAERLGLSKDVLKRASSIYYDRQTDLSKIMSRLNYEKEELEKEKNILNDKIKEYENAKFLYKKELDKLNSLKEKEIEKVRNIEYNKWQKVRDELLKTVDELKERKEIRSPDIASVKGKINKIPKETKIKVKQNLKIGDKVYIKPYQQYGEIVNINKDMYQVVFGIFDLEFKSYDLELVEDKKVKKVKPRVRKTIENKDVVTKKGSLTLDLRGYRAHEVKEAMDMAIDNALLSNLYSLKIIHGFGTGAVRKEVYKYIKNSSHIISHRFGGEGEGLNGVTIVELK